MLLQGTLETVYQGLSALVEKLGEVKSPTFGKYCDCAK